MGGLKQALVGAICSGAGEVGATVGGLKQALVGSVLALVVAAAATAGAAEPIVLGEINPRTGQFAVQGTAIHQGVVLAIEEANVRGGIAGRSLKLVSRDDEGKPQRAIASAEELVGLQRAVALTGGYVDSLVGPISEVADRARVPYVAAASLDERLTARGNRYFFRVSSLKAYVDVMTGVVRDVFKARNVAILYSTTPGASQLARRQKEVLERAGVRVSVFEPFAPGLSDFTSLLARVRAEGAEVILSDTFFADHLLLVRQMAQSRITVKAFLGAFGMEFPNVIRELGPASEGLFGTTSWQPEVNLAGHEAESAAFVDAYTKRFGREPVPLTMHGYAAARAVVRAIESLGASAITGDAVRDALARGEVSTPLGRVRFDEHGDPLAYERVIVQIQNGKHVVVYPPARATAAPMVPAR
ncbi:MAG: ABC transporter substrate-binding protein [Candidatus Rokubacteria bacterium]|nr:ABC transporter substrate-binding protein [Candidatus Rokubacteria bacterium]